MGLTSAFVYAYRTHGGRWIRAVAVKVTLATDFGESHAPDALGSDRGGERTEALRDFPPLPRGHSCPPQSASSEYMKLPHPRPLFPPDNSICPPCPAGKTKVIENGKYISVGL